MEGLTGRIIQDLVERRKLSRKDLKRAVNESSSGRELEEILVESGRLSREDYLEAASRVTGVDSLDLRSWKLHYATAQIVPQSMAQRFNILCVGKEEGRILLAMVDPHDTFALEYVRMRTGFEVEPRCVYVGDLKRAMTDAYSVTVTRIDASTPVGGGGKGAGAQETTRFVVATRERRGRSELLVRDMVPARARTVRSISLPGFPVGRLAAPGEREEETLRVLVEVGSELASTLASDELIHKLLTISMDLLGSEACSLILIGEDSSDLYFKDAVGARSEEVRSIRFPLDEHSLAGYAIQNRTTLRVNDVSRDPRHNREVDSAVRFHTRSVLAVPVRFRDEPLGVIEAVNKREGEFTERDQGVLEILASQAAVALHNAEVLERLQNFYHEAVEILIDTLEASDHLSRHHLVEVARFCTAMGRHLGLSPPEQERLCYAGLLHDIGKVKCTDPEDPGHAALGAGMLGQVRLFRDLVPLVRHHHEHYDGSGYPDGLKGDQIPRLAAVLAIAEAWVEGLSRLEPEAWRDHLHRMHRHFRTRFDPDLRPAFEYAVETIHR